MTWKYSGLGLQFVWCRVWSDPNKHLSSYIDAKKSTKVNRFRGINVLLQRNDFYHLGANSATSDSWDLLHNLCQLLIVFFPIFDSFSLLFDFCVCLHVYMHRWCFWSDNLLLLSSFCLWTIQISEMHSERLLLYFLFSFWVMIYPQNHGWIALLIASVDLFH